MTKFHKRSMRKAPLAGKTILLRADYNVPLTEDGRIDDDFRIKASLPTVKRLLKDGCRVVIISHLGRPDGQRDARYSLDPVAQRLADLLGQDVGFIDDCVGKKVSTAVKGAPKPAVILLENLRFYPEEEANDDDFAARLAADSGAQYFVQDGFGVVHRSHASTDAITNHLPSLAGLLLEREYKMITGAMQKPRRPLVALLGGAKVSDKIGVIKRLVTIADQIIVGGAMANTFLAYHGKAIGQSRIEPGQEEVIADIYDAIDRKVSPRFRDNFLVLPIDVGIADDVSVDAERRNVLADTVSAESYVLDIGERSIERMVAAINRAQTVIWNGTMGMAELPEFAEGSSRAALALAEKRQSVTSIIGGGDTADFVLGWDSEGGDSFSHVSTGGGASLDLMSGQKLPGVEALLDA